ncbi:DUF2993 domain-containing protein [Streptomyces sp. A7024]|uniref:DUF2993 domain-containing protein n=1 Tax=Streptomyces coryli TaxID=1128680 RepID=A0A6G4U3L5_9ACTN|nr:DUF2993 domain-containing protein [Streptomyces coryli]NGN66825.1 DUF2993 domain-containing protein [Streptomyces coryli]
MRALRYALIGLVIIAALAVAGDRFALNRAEDRAASDVQREYALEKKPKIDIKGFPFLTQVLSKEFGHVAIDLSGIQATSGTGGGAPLKLASARADLRDVRVIGNNWDRARAQRAEGKVHLDYDDISAAIPGGIVQVSYGGADAAGNKQVKAGVEVPIIGEQSATGTISVHGGDTIRMKATNTSGLPAFVRKQLNWEWKITDLPAGITLKSVDIDKDGIDITGGGTDVDLQETPR